MKTNKGWYWPWLLGGLMALVLGVNLGFVYVAVSDPSFAVEQDYYQKALDWDHKRDQDRINAELGWTVDFEVAPPAPDGSRRLLARLTDGRGAPVEGALVHVEAFHNARAGLVLEADLSPAADGSGYSAPLPLRRPGLWELRLEARLGGQRFTHTTVEELVPR